jgi:glycerol-3-phosphate acyltransferase PlsY
MNEVILLIFSYLIGSIPTAVWVSKVVYDIDIRDYGSGNAGATNTFRVLGSKWGSFVMLVDMLKGLLVVQLAYFMPVYVSDDFQRTNLQIGLGLVAVIGHIFPIWAEFRGGKGVATLLGLIIGISPLTALGCVGVFLMVLFLTRFVSLSSILAGLAFPVFILVIFNVHNKNYRIFAISVALMVILTHQKNISRLIKGCESKVPIFKNRDKRKERNDSFPQ